jgi:RNA polymerase sigma factor (sigma-70 family)
VQRPVTNRDVRVEDDEWLAIRCQLGEPGAFDELIARWHGPLWAFLRRLVGNDDAARDVLQDAWVRILRGFPRLRDGSRLRAWLFAITRRALMDRLREQYARPIEVELSGDDIAFEPPDDQTENIDALEEALDRLPLVEREVLTLFYLQELSLADIAEALDVPPGTVKSRLFRARKMLRQAVQSGA